MSRALDVPTLKRWLTRSLWLAAWCCWLRLGFGLYRELPRQLGERACSLDLVRLNDQPWGFIGDTNQLVVARGIMSRDEPWIEVFDCDDGKSLRIIPMDGFPYDRTGRKLFSKRFGVYFVNRLGYQLNATGKRLEPGLEMVDLATGDRRTVASTLRYDIVIHPERPWIVFVESEAKYPFKPRLVVYDFIAHKRIFERLERPESKIVERPFFIPESSIVVVQTRAIGVKSLDDVDLELWNLDAEPTLEKTVRALRVGDRPSISTNRRIAFADAHPPSVHVFGIDEGRLLFSEPHVPDGPAGQSGGQSRAVSAEISRCGQSVFGSPPTALWNVETGVEVWRPRDWESAFAVGEADYYCVSENWSKVWESWFPQWKLELRTWRRLGSNELVHRVDASHGMHPTSWNASTTLGVMSDGSVHRLPYVVNYPLLALCQAILALPIVLLWTILRWRRKRKLRMASVTP